MTKLDKDQINSIRELVLELKREYRDIRELEGKLHLKLVKCSTHISRIEGKFQI